VKRAGDPPARPSFMKILMHLWPGSWQTHLANLNKAINTENNRSRASLRRSGGRFQPIAPCSQKEFFVFLGLMMSASCFGKGGDLLFESKSQGIVQPPGMDKHMKKWRFKQLRKLWPTMFEDKSRSDSDPWWRICQLIEQFNVPNS
jgi:hypothetical protein